MTPKESFTKLPWFDTLMPAMIFLLVFWVFSPALKNGFTTYDDPEYVTANPHVASGITVENVKWAFASHGANWHPVTWLSHILDGQLFGLNPKWHHFGNVLLHSLNSALLFLFFYRTTGKPWRSLVVALLFGVHPQRVESVAWISERKDVLSGFFFMVTLLIYSSYAKQLTNTTAEKPKSLWLYAVMFTFTLGLLSKSMLVTLPLVLLLLDFWPLNRMTSIKSFKSLAIEKIPFFALSIMMSIIAYYAQLNGSAMVESLSFRDRLENAIVSYGSYLQLFFKPEALSPLYPFPTASWPMETVLLTLGFIVAVSFAAIKFWRQFPWLASGWFWYLGMLVPVIGLVQVGAQSMADRYTYLPMIGMVFAVVWSLGEQRRLLSLRLMKTTIPLLLIVAFIGQTRLQIGYWRNSEALFQRAVNATTNNTLALVGLGGCLADRGEFKQAIPLYQKAIKISPDYYEAHSNLGLAYMNTGDLDGACSEFTNAMRCRPTESLGPLNLANVLAKKGELADAIVLLNKSISLDPDNTLAHSNLGKLLFIKGDYELAHDEFKKTLRLTPRSAEAHNDLGTALAALGKFDDAILQFQTALQLDPGLKSATENMSKAISLLKSRVQNGNKDRTNP